MRKAVLYREFSPEFDKMLTDHETAWNRFEQRRDFLVEQLKKLNEEINKAKDANFDKLKDFLYTPDFIATYPKDKFHIHVENNEIVFICDETHNNSLKDLLGIDL